MYACSHCGDVQESQTKVVTLEETFPVKGEPTSVSSVVRICDGCEEPVYDRELDSANLARAFDLYRAKHGIISPADIKAIRETYGLTQRSLSNLLGMGEITIHRYESGSIPDDAHNQLLVMVQDTWNMKEILKNRGDCLPASQRRKLTARLDDLIREETPDKMLELAAASVSHKGPDIYTGFLPFDPEKLMEMILFLTNKLKGVYKTKLNKLLWYADFLHYRYFGVSVSGASYLHLPSGPCPDRYDFFLCHLLDEERLISTEMFFENGSGELLSALTTGERTFSASALEVLTAVCKHFGPMSSKDISECSREEEGYLNTRDGDPISYAYADNLKVDLAHLIPALSE